MLLKITTTYRPARDLGFLLHKHPDRCQTFEESVGDVHVFYPEATEERCTAALLLDINPVELVRGRGETLRHYVNDRPYVASSRMSVAIAQVLGTALSGRSADRPELADTAIPLEATLDVVPVHGDPDLIDRLFSPLGYTIETTRHRLDEEYPEWGPSPYYTLSLSHEQRLQELLAHLYILIPVLDDEKHYYVDDEEVDKLFRYGDGWLRDHPERDVIVRRYLQYGEVIEKGFERLSEPETDSDHGEAPRSDPSRRDEQEQALEGSMQLNEQRMGAVASALKASGAQSVLDLGCGEGKLLRRLMNEDQFERVVGLDVSVQALERARDRLELDRRPPVLREKMDLLHGSLIYRDDRLTGFDAAALVEVVEHFEPERLPALERVVFGHASPQTVVVTTPNREYNVLFDPLAPDARRHYDHRFEWTRAEFRDWAADICEQFGYEVEFLPIGPEDPEHGAPTQMAMFTQAPA